MVAKCISCGHAIDTVNDGKICKLFGCPCNDIISCQASDEFRPKPQPNADRIRSMSDEELAELFARNDCGYCRIHDFCFARGFELACEAAWLAWLREDAET